MKAFYYLSRILLYISMALFGFFNFTTWLALTFRVHFPAFGWAILISMAISYACIFIFSHLKKFMIMFITSFIFPLTTLVIGTTLRASASGNLDFTTPYLRNHIFPLAICLFTGLIWAFYSNLPEQKAKRRERDYRKLKPEEKII